MTDEQRIHWRRLLQRRLAIRVTVPALIGLIQLGVVVWDLATGRSSVAVLWWAPPSLVVGYLFGRMTHIAWQRDDTQIALVGGQVALSVIYVVLRIGSRVAAHHTFADHAAAAVVFLVVSFGLFVGRSLGLAGQIWRTLSDGSR
jgi:hypothetical protein